MNDYQKDRFVQRVISAMFNTISKKKVSGQRQQQQQMGSSGPAARKISAQEAEALQRLVRVGGHVALRAPTPRFAPHVIHPQIAVYGFAFKKDTGDTRETPAIDVCRGLVADGANVRRLRAVAWGPCCWLRQHGARLRRLCTAQAAGRAQARAACRDCHCCALTSPPSRALLPPPPPSLPPPPCRCACTTPR